MPQFNVKARKLMTCNQLGLDRLCPKSTQTLLQSNTKGGSKLSAPIGREQKVWIRGVHITVHVQCMKK